jgi:aspartyl-tRNA(Asn)/glutamyl-tRNA(Gln) amidotransferase subunit A
MTPKYSNLSAVQQDLQSGKINLPDLVIFYLENIKKTQDLNIYIEVFEEEALEKARVLQAKFEANPTDVGRLFGMIISLKDVICYKNHKVTAGAKILENFESLFSATAVERVLEEDVIIIGRVNCDQFAMGSTNENTIYGPTRNAANPKKVPGGSSGASAVSVQADTCLAALGTDTGGSVRQPASFCGIIGMKPTYGRVSRYGLLAYGSSFDQIGTLSHSVEDAALLLEIMAGQDDFDATSSAQNVPSYSDFSKNKEKKSKIAYIETAVNHEGLDADVKNLTWQTIEKLQAEGHLVEPVAFDILEYLIPAYYVLTTAEASTNLSRYDGVRFGYRNPEAKDLYETYAKSRTEGFSTEVKRRIMLGTFVLSAGYFDAYYAKAQKVRRLIQDRTREIFKDYDFILLPTSPTPAWNIGESLSDPVAMYLADIFTVHANMAGIPAIALPIGESHDGLPIGIQFMADKFKEAELLAFGKDFLSPI